LSDDRVCGFLFEQSNPRNDYDMVYSNGNEGFT